MPGDAHVASPQACLLVVDSLDPSQLYYLWLYNAYVPAPNLAMQAPSHVVPMAKAGPRA